jgi:hypothetical protein
MNKIRKDIIRIRISSTDIRQDRSLGENKFNGHSMYNVEKYKMNDALTYVKKDWSDILEYHYSVGLIAPSHLGSEDFPEETCNLVDGYEILVKLKNEQPS